jgi:hypothetical protein
MHLSVVLTLAREPSVWCWHLAHFHPLDTVSRRLGGPESKGHRLAGSDVLLRSISWIRRRPGTSYELDRTLAWCSFLYKRDFLRSAFFLWITPF